MSQEVIAVVQVGDGNGCASKGGSRRWQKWIDLECVLKVELAELTGGTKRENS